MKNTQTDEARKRNIGDVFDATVLALAAALVEIDENMTTGEAADWVDEFARTLQNCATTMRENPNGLLGEGK